MSNSRRDSTSTRPVGEEPPYLTEGTDVSAKYRGAFCEATIKSVKKVVKCKVTFDNGGGSSTVTDDCINGVLKVGSCIQVKQPNGHNMSGTLVKITDSSVYTVVFDDGDERTLKRTSLCIKGEKHFNESETLDHLPLTDPENFGTPVVQQGKKKRKGRRPSTSCSVDDSKEVDEITVKKKLLQNEENADKIVKDSTVVMVDITEKKKTFSLPALCVSAVASNYGELKSPENILVRSFKDGEYFEVHPKDVKEFLKDSIATTNFPKGESGPLKLAVENAVKYLETKELPSDWNVDLKSGDMQTENNDGHSSSSEESEEDDKAFMASLTKFLEEKETPLIRSPVLGHRDLDLHKLYKIVSDMGGMDKITSWHSVYGKMDIPVMTTTAAYHIKNAYKRYLFEYEKHQREKESKKNQAEDKRCGARNDKSSTRQNATAAANVAVKQKEETQSKSDSDKELKEQPHDNDLPNHGKPSRGRRAKSKTEVVKTRTDRSKLLKSPVSPKLSPKSPCSPMSLSSVSNSVSGSAGCPSPLENSCESRTKAGDAAAGCDGIAHDEKVLNESDVVSDGKWDDEKTSALIYMNDLEKTKEQTANTDSVVKGSLSDVTKNEIKEKSCRSNGRDGKEAKNDVEDKNEENDEVEVKEEEMKKEETKEEEEEVKMEEDGVGVVEPDDAVDVVNSPVGTSDYGDEEDGRKAEKSSDESEGGNQGGRQGTDKDGGDLQYKMNDRIDVRYGRGRNATVYQAKITALDPDAEENLCYFVHYAGWNARHDEWISAERIIGKGQMQTRTRNGKEPPKNNKLMPTAKPAPKPTAKRNGKSGSVEKQMEKTLPGKGRKGTPSPTSNGASSSRSNNGRASKNRIEKTSVDFLDLAEIKCQPRVTRQNSLSSPIDPPDLECADQKSEDLKAEGGKDHDTCPTNSTSPQPSPVSPRTSPRSPRTSPRSPRTSPRSPRTSPRLQVEKDSESTTEHGEETAASMEVGESATAEVELKETAKAMSSASDNDTEDLNVGVVLDTSLKRPRHDEDTTDSPPPKIRKEDDVASEVIFDHKEDPDCPKEPNEPASPELEATVDEANTPDLTCSEQLSTNCVSPDPYTNEYSRNDAFFDNDIGEEDNGNESKEKDSSSSVDEVKSEKSTNRKAKGRRERKTRAPSSQSSFEGSECQNGSSRETSMMHISSPTRTPKYNFTDDLEELLKKEESSERIRLLQEKMKDIRKIYGELKSEVANIDRKRKRKQKRKREEELSAEEGSTRSPSRSSPLPTTNANTVSPSTSLTTVECR